MVMIGDKIADINRFWAGPAHDPPATGERLDKLVWCPPITPSLTPGRARALKAQGYRYSGHTHPPGYSSVASDGDIAWLNEFGQNRSAVWGAIGRPEVYYRSEQARIAVRMADMVRFREAVLRRYEGRE